MAIIRLDCNLNGGDSVTPNNELFYRIYGDVDAYAAPIHTTGTALTDANVTVDNDNVIITGVDGTTNTTFKIAAVDGAFNEGVLSDASVASIILFQDNFTGTVIDTNKWTVTNPDTGGGMTISQNDELIFTGASPATTVAANKIESDNAYTVKVYSFDWKATPQGTLPGSFSLGIRDALSGAVDQIGFEKSAVAATHLNFFVIDNGTKDHDDDFALDIGTSAVTFKFVIETTTIKCYSWNGSAWVEQSSWTGTLSSTDFYPVIHFASGGSSRVDTIDNLYITDTDFITQYPT